ncbi:MAG: alkaline phosphatase family protein [Gammaproteobacteria bacterium]
MNRTVVTRRMTALAVSAALLGQSAVVPAVAHETQRDWQHRTRTPIEHLIVIIGENHTFDNVFAGYRPRRGQHIENLLSEGIIKADGSPGPHFDKAVQQQASDTDKFSLSPDKTGAYATLPQPNTTYALGQPQNVPDTRFPPDLPAGPFQITKYVPYDAYVGDPAHRFFQMWQQTDMGRHDLFTWVAQTVGIGPQNNNPVLTPDSTYQGGVSMGFYNMSTGDAPDFKWLADHYAISDNYHQEVMGGTGANFFSIVTGDVAYYNTDGKPTPPPANQIENPDPQAGTNNWYTRDGYHGGSYVDCSDPGSPGVGVIDRYLHEVPGKPFRNGDCAPGHYYLVNNYTPGYTPTGEPRPLGPHQYTVPPQTVPTIAGALSHRGISWKWYIGGRNNGNVTNQYCSICDPFVFSRNVMTSSLKDNLQGMTQFDQDVKHADTFPAVAFIRPYEGMAGHPADSTLAAYGKFVMDVINKVKSNKKLWAHTAILITTDEGGGSYDSGYIQPIDFFGDGTRIPMIAVSPYARKGYVDHTYYDHASILKFIERNWRLRPLSERSRDNLPDPVTDGNPYVPVNRPAIGDLMNLFVFGRHHSDRHRRDQDRHDS